LAVVEPYAYVGGGGPYAQLGAIYVFARSGTAWTLQQKLTASDAGSAYTFGYSVSISGNTLAVRVYQGSVYVYARSGTTWTLQQRLTDSDLARDDECGYSVAISGGTVVAGAPNARIGANQSQGAAYVFAP
jgi:hypothetical protein